MSVAGILVLTFAAYLPALRAGFVWDDETWVQNNAALRSLGGLWRIWSDPASQPQYYPLALTAFWVEYHLWGLAPFGYHLVNVALHGCAALVLWRALRRLSISGGEPAAWFGAAIFAAHPVHVESVAWITELKNVLSGVFYLLALDAYLRFAGFTATAEVSRAAPTRPQRAYALAIALYVCALLSKTVTCTLPVALAVILWWKRDRWRWREAAALVPFLVLGALAGLATIFVETRYIGARGAEFNWTLGERCLIAGRALWLYLGKLAWPVGLTFMYPKWPLNTRETLPCLAPALACAAVVALWLARRRIGKAPLAAALFFIITLSPALGFVNVFPMRYSFAADHFQYLASIGPIALFAGLIGRGIQWIEQRRAGTLMPGATGAQASPGGWPVARAALCAAPLLILATLTFRQARIYRDLETLWRDTIAKNPDCAMVHFNLGNLLGQQGDLDGALAQFQEVVRIDPSDADGYGSIGVVLATRGQTSEAMEYYLKAVALKPDSAKIHSNLALALLDNRETGEAIRHFQWALLLKPDLIAAHLGLARALELAGDQTGAAAQYRVTIPYAKNAEDAALLSLLDENLKRLEAPNPEAALP